MKKSLGSLSSLINIFRYGEHLKPVRDWFVLLLVTVILLVLGIGWNVWLFVSSENGKATSTAMVIDRSTATSSIAAIQGVFQERATQETDYQHTYQFVDPSLPGS